MPAISSRTSTFTESVIRRMTRVANQTGAINLSQGFPDFTPPEMLMNALQRVAFNGPHQYAVTWGANNFRKALAEKQQRFMGIPIDPDTNIVVTCGSTEAMMTSMMAVTDPGDKVIVFSPFYENYAADAILTGAIPIYVSLHSPSFSFDIDELRKAFEQRPKAIIICNPGNPTGKIFSHEELTIISKFAMDYDTLVITDEVYEHIVYAPYNHTYFASLPGMLERTLTCSSLSKTYSITGWRLGYVIASPHIIDASRKVHDFLTVGAAAPLQEAAVTALQFPDSYYTDLRELYTKKRSIFLQALDNAGFRYTVPNGAYYVMVDISEFGVTDDVAFCEWMARNAGIAGVPGSSFFREKITNYVRFHYAKSEVTLAEAGKRLIKLRALLGKT